MVQIKIMEATPNHYFATLLQLKILPQQTHKNTPNNPQRFSLLHCLISLAPVFPDQLKDLISRESDVQFRVLFWEMCTRFTTHSPESHRQTQHSQHAPVPSLLCWEVKGALLGRV